MKGSATRARNGLKTPLMFRPECSGLSFRASLPVKKTSALWSNVCKVFNLFLAGTAEPFIHICTF